ELEIVGEVERVEELVRRREDGDRAAVALRDDRAVPGGDGGGRLLRGRLDALQGVVGVEPGDPFPVRLGAGQPGAVEGGAGVFVRSEYAPRVDEPAARVDGEAQLAAERPGGEAVEGDRATPPLASGTDFFPLQHCREGLVRPRRRVVEERVPALAQVPDA